MAYDVQPHSERRGASMHAQEALRTPLQEQKINQAIGKSYLAPGAQEGKSSEIYGLDQKDRIAVHKDGMPVFRLHERFAPIFCTLTS